MLSTLLIVLIASIVQGGIAKENLELMQVDTSDKKSVAAFAEEFKKSHKSLRCLVNNAGIISHKKKLSAAGVEEAFQTNVLVGSAFPTIY